MHSPLKFFNGLPTLNIGSTAGAGGGLSNTDKVLGGVAIGAPTALAGINAIGEARTRANRFVQTYENKFGQKLAEISQLAKTNPELAKQQLLQALQDYEAAGQQFVESVPDIPFVRAEYQKIVNQAFSNSKMLDTVQRLSQEVGLNFAPSGTGGTGITLGGAMTSLHGILDAIRRSGVLNAPGGDTVNNGSTGGAPPSTSGQPEITVDPKTGATTIKFPNGGNAAKTTKSTLESLLPWIFAGTSLGTNLFGLTSSNGAIEKAITAQSDAAKYSADLQNKAATEAIGLQRDIYNQSRQDALPWLNTGKAALGRLSHMAGLKPEGMAPYAPPGPQVSLSNMYPQANPQQQQQPFDPRMMQDIAARYRR